MLSAGFKFICCSTEDDADNPRITWQENLLVMDNLQVRQQEINNQVTMTFLAANNEIAGEFGHKRNKSEQSHARFINEKYSLVKSLGRLSKASGMKLTDFLIV